MGSALTKKLRAIDTQREKNQLSPMECHWAYQPYFRAGPMPGSSCPTQDELHGIFVDFWSHFTVLALFVLLVFCFDIHFCGDLRMCVSWF